MPRTELRSRMAGLPPLPFEERRVALSRGKKKIDFTVDARMARCVCVAMVIACSYMLREYLQNVR